jgi:hypothetical protein
MVFDERKYIEDFENYPTSKLYRFICKCEINEKLLTDEDRKQFVIMKAVYNKRVDKLQATQTIKYIESELPKMGTDLYKEGAEWFLKYLKKKVYDIR